MTVSTIVPVNNYVGNNSVKIFDFDFFIQSQDELEVFHTDANGIVNILQIGIDYSIDEIGNKNGSFINFPLASSSFGILQSNETITLSLSLPIKQESEFSNSSNLNLYVLEQTFDYIIRILQILDRKLARCLKTNEGVVISPDVLMNQLNLNAKSAIESAEISCEALSEIQSSKKIVLENKKMVDEKVQYLENFASKTLTDIQKKGIETRAKIDFSNLNDVAEKHFLNKYQISNCLLEIPHRINFELKNGVLTLKAGSIAIIPNGFEADGLTKYFYNKTIDSDSVYNFLPEQNGLYSLFVSINGGLGWARNDFNASGTSTEELTNGMYYRTDLNKLFFKNKENDTRYSFPLGYCTLTNGLPSNLHIFDGFGYMGSTVWVDKGVKGLIPKGRNADGTLKNQEVTISKVSTRTINSGSSKNQGIVLYGSDITWRNYYVQEEIPSVVARWYNPKTNYMYVNNSSDVSAVQLDNSFLVGYINCTNGKIDNIQINEPFRSTNYNDFQELKNNVETLENSIIDIMYPDYTTYEQKTENTLYQAEEDGWVLIVCSNSNQNSNADLYIGPTQDNLIKVLENGSNVVSHCGAPYPIKKGWYYKAIDEGGYSAIEFGFVSNFK